MSIGIDTSVLVRLLVGQPAEAAAAARERLLEAHQMRRAVIASDLVIAEAYHALIYHYGIEPGAIRQSMHDMLNSGLVRPEPSSAIRVVLTGKPGKAGFVDRLIQARYEADGLTTWTLDRGQARLGRTQYIG